MELPDDVVLAIVDWFEEELAEGMVYEHEFRQFFRECCKANYRIGKQHKYQFMFYVADLLRTYGADSEPQPYSAVPDERLSLDGRSIDLTESRPFFHWLALTPGGITAVVILVAVVGLLVVFSNATESWMGAAAENGVDAALEPERVAAIKTVVLETYSVRADVWFYRLDSQRRRLSDSVEEGPTAPLQSGMYFVSITYPDKSVVEVLRTVPIPEAEADDVAAPDEWPHRGFQKTQRFVVLPEIALRRFRRYNGSTRECATGNLTEVVNQFTYSGSAPELESQIQDEPAEATWDAAVACAESFGMRLPWTAELKEAGFTERQLERIWTIDAVGSLDERRMFAMFQPQVATTPGR